MPNLKMIFWKWIANKYKMKYTSVVGVVDTCTLTPCSGIADSKIESGRYIFKWVAMKWSDGKLMQLFWKWPSGYHDRFLIMCWTNGVRKKHERTHICARTCPYRITQFEETCLTYLYQPSKGDNLLLLLILWNVMWFDEITNLSIYFRNVQWTPLHCVAFRNLFIKSAQWANGQVQWS